jgi:DNA-binding MarR family transcriptional regulator
VAKQKIDDSRVMEFAQAVGALVRRARAAGSSNGLSWTETAVLRRLERGGPTTTAELARTEGMRPQSMRTIITSLEGMGMIVRKAHESDGRQVNLELTAKGRALEKSTTDAKRNWLAQTMESLDAEERATLFAAGKIMRRLVDGKAQ